MQNSLGTSNWRDWGVNTDLCWKVQAPATGDTMGHKTGEARVYVQLWEV